MSIVVTACTELGLVRVEAGNTQINMPPQVARELAFALMEQADKAERG